jgi:hypothetical protein
MSDPYADYTVADDSGAELSIVWVQGGGARIYIGGDQPLDQPPCSILRSREEMVALRDYLNAQLATKTPRLYQAESGIWHMSYMRAGTRCYASLRTKDETEARQRFDEIAKVLDAS